MTNSTKPLTQSEIPDRVNIDLSSQRIVRGKNGKTGLVVDVTCGICAKRRAVRVGSIRFRIKNEDYDGLCIKCYPRSKPKLKGGIIINGGYRWLHRDLLDYETIHALESSSISFSRRDTYIQEHRVVAFKKYGIVALSKDVIIRHRDGNKLNNSPDNLLLGSHQDNKDDHMTSIREAAYWREIALTLFRIITGERTK